MEGLGASGRLGLEGLLLTHVSQLIVLWINYRLEVAERFFAEFFGFLFDNTSACYLVFAFFFSTFLAIILLLCYIDNGLEWFMCLSARIYSILHLV